MIQAMNLTAMTLQLAVNCLLVGVEERACTLSLDPKYQQLRTDRVVKNLEKALQDYFGRPLKLVITDSTAVQDTPAAQFARAKQERQQAAEQEIVRDGTVVAFQEIFDAQVVPGSVQPVD